MSNHWRDVYRLVEAGRPGAQQSTKTSERQEHAVRGWVRPEIPAERKAETTDRSSVRTRVARKG